LTTSFRWLAAFGSVILDAAILAVPLVAAALILPTLAHKSKDLFVPPN
jgi:hypothetical protein